MSILDKFDIEKKLTGDASTRTYWRLKNNQGLLCHDPNPESFNDFQDIQIYLKKKKIRVPNIYNIFPHENILHLEDLGDKTFLLKSSLSHEKEEYLLYKKALEILLILQHEKKSIPPKVTRRSFDKEKYLYELKISSQYFLDKYLHIQSDMVEKIKQDFMLVIDFIIQEPQCFVHRDYHSRNIMITEDSHNLAIIDFQDARMGIPHYDLVSLLEDCYIDLDSENKNKLLQFYWENRPKYLFQRSDFSHFLKTYHFMLLQRTFKAIGSFSYIYATKKDIRYLKYIGFAMEKIRKSLRILEMKNHFSSSLLGAYYES